MPRQKYRKPLFFKKSKAAKQAEEYEEYSETEDYVYRSKNKFSPSQIQKSSKYRREYDFSNYDDEYGEEDQYHRNDYESEMYDTNTANGMSEYTTEESFRFRRRPIQPELDGQNSQYSEYFEELESDSEINQQEGKSLDYFREYPREYSREYPREYPIEREPRRHIHKHSPREYKRKRDLERKPRSSKHKRRESNLLFETKMERSPRIHKRREDDLLFETEMERSPRIHKRREDDLLFETEMERSPRIHKRREDDIFFETEMERSPRIHKRREDDLLFETGMERSPRNQRSRRKSPKRKYPKEDIDDEIEDVPDFYKYPDKRERRNPYRRNFEEQVFRARPLIGNRAFKYKKQENTEEDSRPTEFDSEEEEEEEVEEEEEDENKGTDVRRNDRKQKPKNQGPQYKVYIANAQENQNLFEKIPSPRPREKEVSVTEYNSGSPVGRMKTNNRSPAKNQSTVYLPFVVPDDKDLKLPNRKIIHVESLLENLKAEKPERPLNDETQVFLAKESNPQNIFQQAQKSGKQASIDKESFRLRESLAETQSSKARELLMDGQALKASQIPMANQASKTKEPSLTHPSSVVKDPSVVKHSSTAKEPSVMKNPSIAKDPSMVTHRSVGQNSKQSNAKDYQYSMTQDIQVYTTTSQHSTPLEKKPSWAKRIFSRKKTKDKEYPVDKSYINVAQGADDVVSDTSIKSARSDTSVKSKKSKSGFFDKFRKKDKLKKEMVDADLNVVLDMTQDNCSQIVSVTHPDFKEPRQNTISSRVGFQDERSNATAKKAGLEKQNSQDPQKNVTPQETLSVQNKQTSITREATLSRQPTTDKRNSADSPQSRQSTNIIPKTTQQTSDRKSTLSKAFESQSSGITKEKGLEKQRSKVSLNESVTVIDENPQQLDNPNRQASLQTTESLKKKKQTQSMFQKKGSKTKTAESEGLTPQYGASDKFDPYSIPKGDFSPTPTKTSSLFKTSGKKSKKKGGKSKTILEDESVTEEEQLRKTDIQGCGSFEHPIGNKQFNILPNLPIDSTLLVRLFEVLQYFLGLSIHGTLMEFFANFSREDEE